MNEKNQGGPRRPGDSGAGREGDSTGSASAALPEDPSSEEVGDAEGSGDGVAAQVEELRLELERVNDRHLRLAAEFDNYRRRSQAQLGEAAALAQANLIGRLLTVLDDLERVNALDSEAASVEAVLEGVALVHRKLVHLLEEAGLEEVDPEGEAFDPNVMEALSRLPAESPEEDDTVDRVFQRGFLFSGHLVRPARVSVRKYE